MHAPSSICLLVLIARCAAGLLPTGRRFLLLRHGQTDYNAEGRIQGISDVSRLSAAGERQASAAGVALAAALGELPLDEVFISPLTRAQQTLSIIAKEWPAAGGVESVALDELIEINLRDWAGRLSAEVAIEDPEAYGVWKSNPAELKMSRGLYPTRDVWRRAEAAWDEMRVSYYGGVTLIVAHNAINQVEFAIIWKYDLATLICSYAPSSPLISPPISPLISPLMSDSPPQALLCSAFGLGPEGFRSVLWPNCGCIELVWAEGSEFATAWRWLVSDPELQPQGEWQYGISRPIEFDAQNPADVARFGNV